MRAQSPQPVARESRVSYLHLSLKTWRALVVDRTVLSSTGRVTRTTYGLRLAEVFSKHGHSSKSQILARWSIIFLAASSALWARPRRWRTCAMQVPYELKQSPIAGLGIFATAPIARGTLLWKYDENSVKEYEEAALRARLAPLSAAEAVELCEHVFCWEGKVCEIMDDGKYWNHAKGSKQNTGNHPDGDAHGDGMSSYALRDIAAGEELTDDYALYDKLPWFEAICQERGVTGSCTEVGRQFD